MRIWLQPPTVNDGSEKHTHVQQQQILTCMFVSVRQQTDAFDIKGRGTVCFSPPNWTFCETNAMSIVLFLHTDCPGHHPVGADGSGWTAQSPGGGTHTQWVSRAVCVSVFNSVTSIYFLRLSLCFLVNLKQHTFNVKL